MMHARVDLARTPQRITSLTVWAADSAIEEAQGTCGVSLLISEPTQIARGAFLTREAHLPFQRSMLSHLL